MRPSHYVLSVLLDVPDLDEASGFFCQRLDFEQRRRGDGWAVVDNGALSLRLLDRPGPSSEVVLEVVTDDLDASREWLCRDGGAEVLGEPVAVAADRVEQRLRSRFGVVLVLTRELTEDELGEPPPLPTQLVWSAEAEALVQDLLRLVPLAFRVEARRRMTGRSEVLALEQGDLEVDLPTATRGFIQATPTFQLDALRAALKARGLDPGRYEADFARPD